MILALGLVTLSAGAALTQAGGPDVMPVMERYFELVASGNFDIAGDMWSPEALERSTRFGIGFTDIGLKTDCNSPLIRRWDDITSAIALPIKQKLALDGGKWYRLQYSNLHGAMFLEHYYYAQRRDNWFWFAYAQDYYAADWESVESRYFRVRIDPDARRYIDDVVLNEADRFVESLAERLGMTSDDLGRIGEKKIEYFYCSSDSVVQQITGHLIKGTLDLPSNDVISADFPHFHEISHLLINIRLKELPLYTLPVMREGLAVYLAGRWGKHPAVLMDLATALYSQELLTFDSVFAMRGFEYESGADIVYPVAGLFCGYLIDQIGMERFLELYLKLSGRFEYLKGLTAEQIFAMIAESTGHPDWGALKADFETYLNGYVENRLVARAGIGDAGHELMRNERYKVLESDNWIAFEFKGDDPNSPVTGNLLFAPRENLKEHVSSLFESQYADSMAFPGYRYGVRFDSNEIGLYDYAANQLVAKYVWGITPSDDYYDADHNIVTARFDKSLLRGVLPKDGQCRFLSF